MGLLEFHLAFYVNAWFSCGMEFLSKFLLSTYSLYVIAQKVTDYELKPGGRNIRVTEETKHEYIDLVAEHILTNAIRPQINSFLEGFNELVPRELISIFNDKELELLISGLPEIDCKLCCLSTYLVYAQSRSFL